jgi:hypothetical protein
VYLAFHSFYPGKQERFIFPIVALILVAGVVGLQSRAVSASRPAKRPDLSKGLWTWFWAVNALLLVLMTGTYVKKARCETLSTIWKNHDAEAVIIEGRSSDITRAPRFYLGTEVPVYYVNEGAGVDSLARVFNGSNTPRPNYLVCMGDDNMRARTARLERLGEMQPIATIRPGLLDRFLHMVNPRHNKNYTSRVFSFSMRQAPEQDQL